MRGFSLVLALTVTLAAPSFAASPIKNCSFGGKALYGKVQVVKSFPDFKVQLVTSFPDLRVMNVKSFPDSCGKWQFVTDFPDFTVAYVDAFPDFTVELVESFPGEPCRSPDSALVPNLRFAVDPGVGLFELARQAVERCFVGPFGGEHHADGQAVL